VRDDLKPKTISIDEAARHLGVSRGVAYDAAHDFLNSEGAEGLPVIRLGRRMVVPVARLEQMLGCALAYDEGEPDRTVVDLRPPPPVQDQSWSTRALAPTGTGL
jgi:hypothetical protein